ncbi:MULTISPECIES: helix-hairpin-helix domain-containing protein [unclassified Proteiniphilum]|jgi:DNA uptake protein ComE-like DNA-binding protein|nr:MULTISPECIES: helix-hairpin-helix domain-containing protein [unclassified Proteiniphilum]
MQWKDFLYFRSGSKIAVILLLILIVLTLILNSLLRYRNSSGFIVEQNDSLIREFEEFRNKLKEHEEDYFNIGTENDSAEIFSGRDNFLKEPTVPRDESPGDRKSYSRSEKLSEGQMIILNNSDTVDWKKIPGIGSIYASRIVKYRDLLGGFARVEQLLEVYGIDNELYSSIIPYIYIETNTNLRKVQVNKSEFREMLRHPYLNYKQVQAIINLRRRKGDIVSINELSMLDEFTTDDIYRLEPYLEF